MKKERWIAVIGLGYVGLPLVQLSLNKGYSVVGIDIDRQKISSLLSGKSYLSGFSDGEMKEMLNSGRFRPTDHYGDVEKAEFILICVPTPLKEKEPDLTAVKSVFRSLKPHLHEGQTVILESSTYPGTTEDVVRPMLEETGLKVGKEIHLGYSPERIDPGNRAYPLEKIPKVVSGITPACLRKVEEIYASLFETIVPVSSCRTAEFVKMLENSQRLVNISLINELNVLAHRLNIDLWEVIEAAKTKPYGFTPYYPSAGAGGHCIPVDPLYLVWAAMKEGVRLTMIEEAERVNDLAPHFIVANVREILRLRNIPFRDAKIGVIGITYKKDVNDIRESAALKVVYLLQEEGMKPAVYDPLYPDELPGISRLPWAEESFRSCDLMLILVDHSQIPWAEVVRMSRLVFDTRNVTRGMEAPHVIRR